MNSRIFVELNKDSFGQEHIEFTPLPQQEEDVLRKYMAAAEHICELDQLYRMMRYNLENIFKNYELRFDDCVFSCTGETVENIEINALIGNAISSARTLIESMEICDQTYISEEGNFKKFFISTAYDEYMSYRIVDFLRNYMQHGHVPISYDGQKIFINLAEILDVEHMRINAKLKQQFQKLKEELLNCGAMETRLSCVILLYEYFLIVHMLYLEFYQYAEWNLAKIYKDAQSLIHEHPEYIHQMRDSKFVSVYADERSLLHGFFADVNFEDVIQENMREAQRQLEDYQDSNGNLMRLEIHYCLEYRMPQLCFVGDDVLSENLVEYCIKRGHEIRHLSFEKYYGEMSQYTVHCLFPYIQLEDGIAWNVPYAEVTIGDFIRTFPEVKHTGISVNANNVAGGGLFDEIFRSWSAFLEQFDVVLNILDIHSVADALDWIPRVGLVKQGIQWLMKSFSLKKEKKPEIGALKQYIRRQNEWKLSELTENMHAEPNLLKIVLMESGYISGDGETYRYDESVAEKIQKAYEECSKKQGPVEQFCEAEDENGADE